MAGQEINDIIIDTGSAASIISTVLWNKLKSNYPLKNITTKYIAANEEILNVQGASELPVQVSSLNVILKFIIVVTNLFDVLFDYDFLRWNKCDVITSLNVLLAGNVCVPTYFRQFK